MQQGTLSPETYDSTSPLGLFQWRLGLANERTGKELRAIWGELERIVSPVVEELGQAQAPESFESLHDYRRRARESCFNKPYRALERLMLQRRVTLAFETYDRVLQDAVDSAPYEMTVSLEDLCGWLGTKPSRSKKVKSRKLRPHLQALNTEFGNRRAGLEDRILHAVVEGLLVLKRVWAPYAIARPGQSFPVVDDVVKRWAGLKDIAEAGLKDWGSWAETSWTRFAAGLRKRVDKKPKKPEDARSAHFEYWEAKVGSVEGELRLERSGEAATDRLWRGFCEFERALNQERDDLFREMTSLSGWLEALLRGKADPHPPNPQARIAPFERRWNDLKSHLKAASKEYPLNLTLMPNLSVHAPRRVQWRRLYPVDALAKAWERQDFRLRLLLEARLAEHRELLQGIERARDVIRFGLDLEGEAGELVAREALENALSLMKFQLEEKTGQAESIKSEGGKWLFELSIDLRSRLDPNVYKVLFHRLRSHITRESRHLRQGTGTALRTSTTRFVDVGQTRVHGFLSSIGFTRSESTISSVEVRNYLPTEFVTADERQLPAIYRRLFKIEPLEDVRFLVGRTLEMQAVTEAVGLWEQGRAVAILLTGQRGSGKTSLLNCMREEFGEHRISRGEFSQRLLDEQSMEEFLRALLEIPEGDLIEELCKEPRIIILEEMERTYLRKIGGFKAVKFLQQVIGATSHRVLWVVAINEVCFHFLNRAVDLSQGFTHRIKTAVASKADLQAAIMVRHNLSGLRLRFSSRHVTDSRWRELVKWVKGGEEPEELFFEKLATQSGGVYRTALEVWLGHIDAFEAGVLYMRQIQAPKLDGILTELDSDDLFTLVAVLQHGSLEIDEHRQVFSCRELTSRTQLEELVGRDLIEPDPHHPGYRVRPEAMPVVKEALYRRNLL